MKKLPWKFILSCVGWLLLVAGIVPGAYVLVRLGNTDNQKPLSVPVSLKEGEFKSPYFTLDSGKDHLVSLTWDLTPARQTSVDLEWKLVADNGAILQQGHYLDLLRGANFIVLGTYKPTPGQREQVVLNVHADVDQGNAQAKLEVAPPDQTSMLSDLIPGAAAWAGLVALPGALLLIVIAIRGVKSEKKKTAARV